MICPFCKTDNKSGAYSCAHCDYGLAIRPKPENRKPGYIGDSGNETRDQQLGRTYRCSQCRSFGGHVKRISTTGAGLSRIYDLQINEFIVVSCTFCGLIQMYDPTVIDKVSSGWPIWDLLSDLG